MTDLAAQLLATRLGVATLATGEASGRLEGALRDPGLTLCLIGHALREVRRGTDAGRIEQLRSTPPDWLVAAAEATARRTDLGWWSRPATAGIQRQVSDAITGDEVVDHQGRARSIAEEAAAHLHTFSVDAPDVAVRRWRPTASVVIAELDGPDDWLAAGSALPRDVDGVHLTVRGLLTIEPPTSGPWPWETAGTAWLDPVPGTPLSDDHLASWHHDHDWVEIGRPVDPRFDEGDDVDGSELG